MVRSCAETIVTTDYLCVWEMTAWGGEPEGPACQRAAGDDPEFIQEIQAVKLLATHYKRKQLRSAILAWAARGYLVCKPAHRIFPGSADQPLREPGANGSPRQLPVGGGACTATGVRACMSMQLLEIADKYNFVALAGTGQGREDAGIIGIDDTSDIRVMFIPANGTG